MVLSSDDVARFWSQVEKGARCWLWKGRIFPNGYGRFRVWRGGKDWSLLAHRVAWELENGPIPEGTNVCHHCDTPRCVRATLCLFLGTQKENLQDASRKGRLHGPGTRGELANAAKLTEKQVAEARRRYSDGETQEEIAGRLGVSRTTISRLLRGATWGGEKITTPKRWMGGGRMLLPRARKPKAARVVEPVRYASNPTRLAVPCELSPGESARFWEKVAPPNERGCRLWLASQDSHGHGQFGVPPPQRVAKAHRVAWRLTYGPIPKGVQLNHICDVRHCVEPTHLRGGTQQQNLQDIAARGRWNPYASRGADNVNAKLDWEKVRELRRLRAEDGLTLIDLGAKFGIGTSQVSNIINHRQWVVGK